MKLRRLIPILAAFGLLALPAGAYGKTGLSERQARAAIEVQDEHVTLSTCSHQNRVTVTCAYSELLIYTDIPIEVEDPLAEWRSWVTVIQGRHRMVITWG